MHDLLVIPQTGSTIPAPHLNPQDAKQVFADWQAYGNEPSPKPVKEVWTIAVAHWKDGKFTITSQFEIPRRDDHQEPQLATVTVLNFQHSHNAHVTINQAAA